MTSMPALQKADTAVNTDTQTPLGPSSGTNTVIYKRAPAPSITNVPTKTFFTKVPRPDRALRLKASCSSTLSERPILR